MTNKNQTKHVKKLTNDSNWIAYWIENFCRFKADRGIYLFEENLALEKTQHQIWPTLRCLD